ncbi:MAG TPA: hypothetical protein VF791_10545 [Pyrinomonadaceae bacterium]
MKQKDETEYQAKVIDDSGLTRGRVPHPILRLLGARAGDFMIFRLADAGKATLRVSRSRKKPGKGIKRR